VTASPESGVPPPEGDPGPARRGTVYLSRHAIHSLTRSATETSPIVSRPAEDTPTTADVSAEDAGVPADVPGSGGEVAPAAEMSGSGEGAVAAADVSGSGEGAAALADVSGSGEDVATAAGMCAPAEKIATPANPDRPALDAAADRPATHDEVAAPAAAEVAAANNAKPPRVRRKGRVFLPVLVAAVTGIVVAAGYLAVHAPRPPSGLGRWASGGAGSAAAADPVATGIPNPFGSPAPELRGRPTRLKVTAIGVDTPLETLHLDKEGELNPPADFAKAGWYADGTVPGDQGPAVIAGHVDNKRGPAVFYRLRELEAGDRIEVVRGGTIVRFTVTSTAWYPKTAFPATEVYGPTPDSQLRLITCGGVFDHRLRSYKDNLVVYAVAG
jgi:LPXTG-site transpeptidase (sortase) family protein